MIIVSVVSVLVLTYCIANGTKILNVFNPAVSIQLTVDFICRQHSFLFINDDKFSFIWLLKIITLMLCDQYLIGDISYLNTCMLYTTLIYDTTNSYSNFVRVKV